MAGGARSPSREVHFWPIAIEVDGHCSASFLKFATNVCTVAPLKNWLSRTPKLLSSAGENALHASFTRRILNFLHNVLLLPVVPCYAYLLVLLMKCKTMNYRPTCPPKLLTAVPIATANGNPETPGLPASVLKRMQGGKRAHQIGLRLKPAGPITVRL